MLSCRGQHEVTTKLTIHNTTPYVLDSIVVYDLLDKTTTYRDVAPNAIIVKTVKEEASQLPKGERGVFSINAFSGNYFISYTAGFIGFPTAALEDEYTVYIKDGFMTEKKDFIPRVTDQRQKIEDYH